LDFHHLNGKEKEFGLSQKGITRSWAKTELELKKCILVCSNCHREIHAGITQPPSAMMDGKQGELRET
jgi:predicted HNH restriction endonuclease